MVAPKKKPATKKTGAKPAAARKNTKAQYTDPEYRSFKRADNPKPFFKFRFTQQTVYWLILALLILGLGAWVVGLSVKVQRMYDHAEGNGKTDTSLEHTDHSGHEH